MILKKKGVLLDFLINPIKKLIGTDILKHSRIRLNFIILSKILVPFIACMYQWSKLYESLFYLLLPRQAQNVILRRVNIEYPFCILQLMVESFGHLI